MPAFDDFLKAFPDYQGTGRIDALRASEYRRLDAQHHVYLDYTGGGLHAESQVREHTALLNDRVLGNPHSVSLTSSGMTDLVERARRAVLAWFNAEGEYTAIFTQNATAALKHVGESYPFGPQGRYLLSDGQPQFGERHPRVCSRERRGRRHTCRSPPLSCASIAIDCGSCWRRRPRPRTTCLRFLRSRISRV